MKKRGHVYFSQNVLDRINRYIACLFKKTGKTRTQRFVVEEAVEEYLDKLGIK